MPYGQPVVDLIRQRVSCRHYVETPIDEDRRHLLEGYLSTLRRGPFGTAVRLVLIAAHEGDAHSLRGLGTYGFIQGATGYIAGAVGRGARNLEDYGYLMECAVLQATDLGLGTCWLGGTFAKSRFARAIGLQRGEALPAAVATGFAARGGTLQDSIGRAVAGSDRRLPWQALFFDGRLGQLLSPEVAGPYAAPLEMVRLGPSASNKQPWRVVRDGQSYHFLLQRRGVYRPLTLGLVGIADMPRLDLGIALCHFELTARELGLAGSWQVAPPGSVAGDEGAEYTATWVSAA